MTTTLTLPLDFAQAAGHAHGFHQRRLQELVTEQTWPPCQPSALLARRLSLAPPHPLAGLLGHLHGTPAPDRPDAMDEWPHPQTE